MRRSLGLVGGLLALTAVMKVIALRADDPAASKEFFETKIRPVLATNCYACHTSAQSGDLRVDSREALIKGGAHGAAIVPGDPDKSLLITALRQTEDDLKMPLGGKLKDSEIEDIAAWIKAGANWPKEDAPAVTNAAPIPVPGPPGAFSAMIDPNVTIPPYTIDPEKRKLWSLQALKEPAQPVVKDPRWSKDPIDKFVYAKYEEQGLKPAAPATKHDLIRRATVDLIGLEPTQEEIDAFEKDNSPDAFAKVVDRLLASPHYGERWGRVWLDVARYGEDDYRSLEPGTRGVRSYSNAYAYRDWVIDAFNDDLPYDQFVKAQIAGDLMDEKVRYKMLPATGFLGLGPWYYDNGSYEVTRADERHDRVDVVTRGFLGLTVACARCHNHKYDPIPQSDYYSLAGVFYNTVYEEYPTAPKSVVDAYTKLEDELDAKNKLIQEENNNLSSELQRTYALETSNYLQGVFEVVNQKRDKAQVVEQRKLDYEVLDRWIKYMDKPTNKYHNKDAWQAMMKKTNANAQDAKKLADQFQQEVMDAMLAKADIDAQNNVIKDKDIEGTKAKKRTDKPSNFESNRDFNPGSWLRLLSLPDEQNNFYTEIFVREVKDSEDPNAMMAMGGGRNQGGGVLSFRGWGLNSRVGPEAQARLKVLQDDVDALKKKLDAEKYPFIHGVKDAETPVDLQLAVRGDPMHLGPVVPRHFLTILSNGDPKPFAKGSGRMELAEDIVKQPIAMRVIVNRIWKEHFGSGIVDTPSNFGQAGERPTNPELIEYLASDFVKNGMSIKKLQREIMLTQVYQLSTQNDETNYAKDSGDRYYWRANRKRLTAEELRDSVLQISGNLDLSLGGPSEDLTPSFLRRTVYGKVSRVRLDQYLQTFDFPTPNISAEKRFTTTVPLQRLFLMNSDFMQIESEDLAKRVANEPDNTARIKKVYSIAFGRAPTEAEIKLGLDYLHNEPMKEYEENKAKAAEDAKNGGDKGGRGGGGGKGGGGGNFGGGKGGGKGKGFGKGGGGGGDAAAADGAGGGEADANAGMGMGMMGGVGRGGRGAPPPPKYDATPWGRYIKVLLSSSEFTFTN